MLGRVAEVGVAYTARTACSMLRGAADHLT
jgi:hypothetical protein